MKAYIIFTPGYENLGTLPSGRLVWKTEEEAFGFLDFLTNSGYPSDYDLFEIEMNSEWSASTTASSIHKGLFCTINSSSILRKVSKKTISYFELWED